MLNRNHLLIAVVTVALVGGIALPALANDNGDIELPPPRQEGGMPLMEALGNRRTQREFSERPLPEQMLSDLLWAAWGVNRPEEGKRTAPSANNLQATDLYVALESGLYLYNAQENVLELIKDEDIRETVGRQDLTQEAPVGLMYTADFTKRRGNEERKRFDSACDVGFIGQNVYLFAASEGLATVVMGWIDRDALAERMDLRDDQWVVLTQAVGFPAEEEDEE